MWISRDNNIIQIDLPDIAAANYPGLSGLCLGYSVFRTVKLVLKLVWLLSRQYVNDVQVSRLESNGNGLGDIWWTNKLFYFSIIDTT